MSKKLTPKQELFVAEYLKDLNASAACLRAGYKTKWPDRLGHEILEKTREQVSAALSKRQQKLEISADTVLKELYRIGTVDLGQAYDESGNLKALKDIPEDVRRAISQIETYYEPDGIDENGETKYVAVKKVKFVEKNKALELLGKHLKLYTDKVEHSGQIGLAIDLDGISEDEKKRLLKKYTKILGDEST